MIALLLSVLINIIFVPLVTSAPPDPISATLVVADTSTRVNVSGAVANRSRTRLEDVALYVQFYDQFLPIGPVYAYNVADIIEPGASRQFGVSIGTPINNWSHYEGSIEWRGHRSPFLAEGE